MASPDYRPSDAFSQRYTKAKKRRDELESDLRSVMTFCAPGRQNDFVFTETREDQDVETFTSIGEELATDLASDLVSYYTPSEARWAEYLVTAPVPRNQAKAVKQLVQEREDTLWALIEGSNYNDVALPMMTEAALHGTPALWVDSAHTMMPVHCEVVPPHELLVVPGHLGYLDRFREVRVGANTLPALLNVREQDFPMEIQTLIRNKTMPVVTVCWGFWIEWEDPGNPVWKREITVQGKCIGEKGEVLGPLAGSCPLLVGRFNPQPGKAWGRGAGLKALPDLRTLDKIDEVCLTNLDQALEPSIIYPGDGVLDLSEGLQAGRAYPAARGFTANQVWQAPSGVTLDLGWYEQDKIEARLRSCFYQDGPRQRGDTPPSASQWLDERRRVQQRLGKPSSGLWTELIYPLIQRIETLGVQVGRLEDAITHEGQSIAVTPLSPLQKAQNQDKVMTARSNLDLGMQTFGPEALPTIVDARSTFQNIVTASGDELTVIAEDAPDGPQTPPGPAGPAA